ncbi:zf-HC2 domain-containing protein [Streptomyces sp. NPDC018031]|uniref:zf-HC2 domain-containing protein n=1 Tax=Streptomyces sp. NPDC018031 TaxID=3365033 RepID=UPI0037A45BC5
MTWPYRTAHGTAEGAWHVDGEMSARYAAGTLDEAAEWSLEKHVEVCGDCAVTVSLAVCSRRDTAHVVADVRAALLAAVPAAAPARSGTAGRPGRARWSVRLLWAAGPALWGAWLVAVLVVCVGAVVLAYGAGFDGVRPVLLAVAPLLPLAGVAVSYGPSADPVHEIALAAPSGGLRLLLTRCAAVLAVSLPLLTAASAVAPDRPGVPGPAAWLLPGLALTLSCLALGSYIGCLAAAGILAGGWSLALLAPVVLADRPGGGVLPLGALTERLDACLTGAGPQSGWAAAAVAGAALVALRRHAFDFGPGSVRPRA